VLDVLYGVEFNDLNVRFYRRLDGLIATLNLVLGSAAAATLIAKLPGLAGWSGLAIAVLSAIQKTVNPADKALKCAEHRAKYGDLAGRAAEMSLAGVDKELRALQATGPDTIAALAIPAYNANLRSNGYEAHVIHPVPILSRVACLLA